MAILTRKQREIQQREAAILEVSRPLLVREGYHGLNMDRIAETLEYSKGTIYNHFPCKEEIIIALAIETLEKRTDLFQRAAAFRGKSRERILAIGYAADLFVELFPDHFFVDQIIRSVSIWEKTSEKRRSIMRACEHRCLGIVSGIVLDAVSQGDLELPPNFTPADLVFGLWSQFHGAYSIITTSNSLEELGIKDPVPTLRLNTQKMLDGFAWKPLSTQYDVKSVIQRIQDEVFHDESLQTNSI